LQSRFGPCAAGVLVCEHQKCGQAAIKHQDQFPALNLGNLPTTNIVADSHTHHFSGGTRANNGASILAIHDDTE
jgi:hypothetical protein